MRGRDDDDGGSGRDDDDDGGFFGLARSARTRPRSESEAEATARRLVENLNLPGGSWPRSKNEAEAAARKLVDRWSVGAAVAGLIPGANVALIAGNFVLAKSVAMLFEVADKDTAGTMAAVAGSTLGQAAAGLLSFIPVIGSIVAAQATKAVGEAVIAHYKSLSKLRDN